VVAARERVGCSNSVSGWEADLGRGSEIGRRGQGDATVNLSVFRRHPCSASALGSACKLDNPAL
jgi:hypothetical protein